MTVFIAIVYLGILGTAGILLESWGLMIIAVLGAGFVATYW